MKKPKKTCSIYIEKPVDNVLPFWAPGWVAQKMESFGGHLEHENGKWYLYIDRRYDMQEVIAYLESLGAQSEGIS